MDLEPFSGRLLRNETILWSGRPRQGIVFTPGDAMLIPFSLLWGGFAIFWETSVLKTNAPFFMALFGVPFVLIGLFMIFGRFLLDAWLRTKIAYALTNQRVLIARSGPWADFKAVSLDRLPEATLSESASGRGTIRFGQQSSVWGGRRGGFGSWAPALDQVPQFLAIDDARRVFDLIQARAQGVR